MSQLHLLCINHSCDNTPRYRIHSTCALDSNLKHPTRVFPQLRAVHYRNIPPEPDVSVQVSSSINSKKNPFSHNYENPVKLFT